MAVHSPLLLKGKGKGLFSHLTVEREGKVLVYLPSAEGEGRDDCYNSP